MVAVKRAYVDSPEGQIHYRTAGSGEQILLIHQACSSSAEFTRVMAILAEKYRVIALDLPGNGDSDKPSRAYQIPDYVQSTIGFLDSLGIEKANVVGQHGGANVAAELAVTQPERVDKLIFSGLPVHKEANAPLPDFMKPWHLKEDGSHVMQVWEVAKSWGPRAPLEIIQELALDYFKAGPDDEEFHQASWQYLVLPRLPLIKSPTLLLSGRHDLALVGGGAVPSDTSSLERVTQLIPRSKIMIIEGPGTGPLVPRRRPEAFAEAVLNFVQNPGV
ncbi:alpha/beta fold hydrolase [Chloroflexota bacterium]